MDAQRGKLLKDLVIFQVKLGLDTLFDLLLSPLALACGIADIARGSDRQHSLLRELKVAGHHWERWLNLYGETGANRGGSRQNADRLFRKAEIHARRKMREQRKATSTRDQPSGAE